MHYANNTELTSYEGTRCQFNGRAGVIKLGIDQIAPATAGRIGVRAVGTNTNEQKGEETLQKKPPILINQAYDLTNHLHTRPPHLTPHIGLDLIVLGRVVMQFRGPAVSRCALFLGFFGVQVGEQPERPKENVEQESNGMICGEGEKPPTRVPLVVTSFPQHAVAWEPRPLWTAQEENVPNDTKSYDQVSAEDTCDYDDCDVGVTFCKQTVNYSVFCRKCLQILCLP
jgi:hypothetical protein